MRRYVCQKQPLVMTHAEIEAEAQRRYELHKGQASQKALAPDHDLKGVLGEVQWADTSGEPMAPPVTHGGGDNGIDGYAWTIHGDFPVDVKAAAIPKNLWVKQGWAKRGTIYILGQYHDLGPGNRWVELLRWQKGSIVLEAPVINTPGDILVNSIPFNDLREIDELVEVCRFVKDFTMDEVRTELRQHHHAGLAGKPRSERISQRIAALWRRVDEDAKKG
jgi:hypothetical protein